MPRARVKVELFLTPMEDLRKDDFIWVNDPMIGFGPGGKAMTAARVFQCVRSVVHRTDQPCCEVYTTDGNKHIIENDAYVLVVKQSS